MFMCRPATEAWRIGRTPRPMASGHWWWKWIARRGFPAGWFRWMEVRPAGGWARPEPDAPRRPSGAAHLGTDRRGRHRYGAGWPFLPHGRGAQAKFGLAARFQRRTPGFAGRV